MKKILFLALASCFELGTFAQRIVPKMIEDGFYRAQNYMTQRYAYLYDNTGSLKISTTSADVGAVVLYRADAHDRFSDPASVLYVSNVENWNLGWKNDLESQNTGFYDIIEHFVKLELCNVYGKKLYQLHETSQNLYLGDRTAGTTSAKSYVDKLDNKKLDNRQYWELFPVSAQDDSNYLGITPDAGMKVGDKYYKPYIVGFAMSFYSPGMKAYYVCKVTPEAVVIREVEGNVVPRNTPIIVECSASSASHNRVELYPETPAALTGNKLTGQYFCYEGHGVTGYKEYDATSMRVLTVKGGRLFFYTPEAGEASRTTQLPFKKTGDDKVVVTTYKQCLNANEAYLVVPSNFPAEVPVATYEEYAASHPFEVYDINIDGKIDLQDLQCINDMMLQKTTKWTRADVNGDGRYSIGDVTSYIKFLMNRK